MIILSNIIAIFRKEFKSYFSSPFAYVVAGFFWLMSGGLFVLILLGPSGIIQQVTEQEKLGVTMPPVDVAYLLIVSFFDVLGSLSLFILPMLSMGLYAQERQQGTLELLATSPITNWAVAIGKLLGVLTFFITMILPLVMYEIIAFSSAKPPVLATIPLLAHVGLILLAAAILSLGMFISSLTNNTVLAAIFTFILVIFLWGIEAVSVNIEGIFGEILGYFSLLRHYNNLIQGLFNPSSILVFLSYIFSGIFLTAQSIYSLRLAR